MTTPRLGPALALFLTLSGAGLARAEPSYRLSQAPLVSAKAGVVAATTVEVKPGPGYHFNKDYPTSLKLDPNAEVDAPAKLTAKDAGVKVAEEGASFEVKLTPKSPGKKAVTGLLSFAVCTASTCVPTREKVTLNLDVK